MMNWLRQLKFRLSTLFGRRRLEAEMSDELGHHLELRIERNIAAGMSPDEARYAALRSFGGVEQVKERAREARDWLWVERTLTDFKYTLRQLRGAPIFTISVICVLALGIGVATTVFSVSYPSLLSPLRYHDSRQLVLLRSQHRDQGSASLAPATFTDIQNGARSFEVLAAQYPYYSNLTKIGAPKSITGLLATGDYFRLFGVAPLHGRTWLLEETKSSAAPVVVLSNQLWEEQYGRSREVISQTIMIDDVAHTVIGVMPPGFKDPLIDAKIWRPIRMDSEETSNRNFRFWTSFARLKSGVTADQADAELARIGQRLEGEHGEHYRDWTLQCRELGKFVAGNYRDGLLVVLGAVACVMLIAIANVGGLLALRTAARRRELAIRVALGASRRRVLGQLLNENLLLSLAGGALGVLLARWSIDLLLHTGAVSWLPRSDEIALNLPALVAAIALTLFTALILGLAPGYAASRANPYHAFKDMAPAAGGAGIRRLRVGLVIAEIALALMLLVGAGLLGGSLMRILSKRSGIDAARILSVTVSLSGKRYDTPAKCTDFYARVLDEVSTLPGVESAGFTHTVPFRWGRPITLVPVQSDGNVTATNLPPTFYDPVSVNYFRTIGNPLLAGRHFTAADGPDATPVAIISESTARRFFGTENPLGRYLTTGPESGLRLTIVGVVADIRRAGLAEAIPLQAYCPLAQRPPGFATLMVRTLLPPASLARDVQSALWRVDPDAAVAEVAPMDLLIRQSVAQPRSYLTFFAVFAALALVLTIVGLYGLIGYNVARRTREFGIRIALGASPRTLRLLVLREAAAVIGIGLCIGAVGSLVAARLLRSVVFEISVHDPMVYSIVALLLAIIAVLASYLPANRVTRVDPILALRSE